ncbi:uncharacterized protein LOC143037146 [Oratosquilla oratoria]|uniref:uncharacterized protein LOC143037146 n=1 Tax=Oratosquilla oratoria TaxID=337810 RepID=UPI003F770847
MSAELQVVTTQRGAQKILLDGFMYTKKHVSKSANEVVWRCIQRDVKCSARLKTTKSLSDHRLVGEHSHIADRVRCDVEQARQYMKRKAATTNDRPNNILSFTSLQKLDITGPWASNLLYDNGPAADERIIVFASPGHLEQLAACDDWCMDGTFSVAPRLFTQLYVVQGRIAEGYFPLAFALLQRKTQTTYEELFRVLEQHGCDPSTVIVDFERPVELGLRAVFGEEIQFRFCFYHLSQSIWRQIQGLGHKNLYESDDEFRLFCGQLDALAFLPTEDVHEGMKHLRSTMPNEAAALVEYFDSTYVSGQLHHQRRVTPTPGRVIQPVRLRRTPPMFLLERWNQHHATLNNEPCTNNICKGWNNKFSSLVGHSNPTIWKLIECLQAEASNVDSVLLQDERGSRPVKRRKKCYAELQTRLCNLVGDLKAGKKTLPEFLRGVSYNLRGGKPNI